MKFALLLFTILIATPISPVFGQTSTRDDFREFVGSIEGRWIGSTTWATDTPFGKKGDKTTTYFESTLASDGNILIGKYLAGEGTGSWIVSYDPGAKQIKVLWTNSGGGHREGTIEKIDGQWTQRGKGTMFDGSTITLREALTVSDDGDTHTWKASVKVGDSEPEPSQNTWHRVYKPSRKI